MAGELSYRRKYNRNNYLKRGDPINLVEADLTGISGWVPIEELKREMWPDSKLIVDHKNKNRDFLVTYDKEPTRLPNGYFQWKIEMLHTDHRGFVYTAEAPDKESLCKLFWPVVELLIAHFLSPKIRRPSALPFTDEETRSTPIKMY